jgi:hypothetical protein
VLYTYILIDKKNNMTIVELQEQVNELFPNDDFIEVSMLEGDTLLQNIPSWNPQGSEAVHQKIEATPVV